MFRRLLVANRGEIARRILRSARELSVETVVVHSAADDEAPWLAEADRAVCIGPAAAERSYLDADAVLEAARQTDCQAIHPGYGFLSENALFAARCRQQGIAFVGPPPEAIRRMGDKAVARRTMEEAGLPTIPGSGGVLRDAQEARAVAGEIGYPVLLKATAGGGGKGMRRCDDESALPDKFAEASLEALKAFGDAGLYLERCLIGARHVEFQLLVDDDGRAIHLGERECSVQRRHQKLVEESGSPAVTPEERDELGARVAAAAAAIGYRNAGTVEFLRDAQGRFYFMEMNTRLQVEHPVTEMRSGVDLVAEQLRIAAGMPLTLAQHELELRGHAIELRINAEDPSRGFRPTPGTIGALRAPQAGGDGVRVRWDSAIEVGTRISPYYDSMIGKLIVHAPDRETAIAGAIEALDSLQVEGVATTAALHAAILRHPAFASGDYDVAFLEDSGLLAGGGD